MNYGLHWYNKQAVLLGNNWPPYWLTITLEICDYPNFINIAPSTENIKGYFSLLYFRLTTEFFIDATPHFWSFKFFQSYKLWTSLFCKKEPEKRERDINRTFIVTFNDWALNCFWIGTYLAKKGKKKYKKKKSAGRKKN